jgi:predicted nucleic acid-binding protein
MPEIEFCFVDTNIWLYAFIDDDAAEKDAAALTSGVKTLYSEDMQHGQIIGKILKIVNPFSA